jgi:hypothetical protein
LNEQKKLRKKTGGQGEMHPTTAKLSSKIFVLKEKAVI